MVKDKNQLSFEQKALPNERLDLALQQKEEFVQLKYPKEKDETNKRFTKNNNKIGKNV